MKKFGLIGHPVGHSWSKEIHEDYYQRHNIKATYELIDMPSIECFREVMAMMDGVNVTIPYKKAIMPYLDVISEEASAVGAVNTVVRKRDGLLYGCNTDVAGFRLLAEGIEGRRVLILGDGGAAQAVKYVLREKGCSFRSVTHREMDNGMISIRGYDVVVNTTPLGMFPNIESCPPVDFDEVTEGMVFLDLVYNPEETEFMRRAALKGANIRGGYVMLAEQAKKAIELFLEN